MSQTFAVPAGASAGASAPRIAARRSDADRHFYLIASAAMLIFTLVGFREFFLRGNALGGDITALLLLLQAALSRTLNRAFVIGYAGVVLAGFLAAGIASTSLWVRFTASIVP
jgi:hypothetical protein